MSFQKCPICNGTGIEQNTYTSNATLTCETCNGKRIISELTGLPPVNFSYTIENEEIKN